MPESLTPHQKKTLEEIERRFGEGEWFWSWDLPHTIRRPEFTCEILQRKGYLERRYDPEHYSPQFRGKAA